MNSKDHQKGHCEEGDPNDSKLNMKAPSSSTSRHWGGLRNPRIVRVSRSFGGKDRHSKVYTVRGLRDRRIRLSVPTAIQLYGLQDKLGLSQPSKVVDWLLDAAKSDIDKLPPLQMPQGNLGQFFQQSTTHLQSSMPHFFNPNSYGKLQGEKDKWINATNVQENQEGSSFEGYASQITAQNFFPIVNQSSYFPYNYNSYYQLEPNPNLSLSQFGSNNYNMFSNQTEEHQSLYFCPSSSSSTIPTIFNPPLPSYTTMENSNDHSNRQINHFQILNPSSQQLPLIPTLHFISSPMKSLSFNVNPKILQPQENDENGGNGP